MANQWTHKIFIGMIVSMAVMGMFIFPKFGKKQNPYAGKDENGNIVIKADSLSAEKVSFLHIDKDSKIEILAILGDEGEIRIALGACQACGGSPYAYYIQKDDNLICNNCGLALPLSEIGEAGSGCHPIQIPEKIITKTEEDLVLNTEEIMKFETLFEKVIAH